MLPLRHCNHDSSSNF